MLRMNFLSVQGLLSYDSVISLHFSPFQSFVVDLVIVLFVKINTDNVSGTLRSKIEVPYRRMFETQKVRRHDKFGKKWFQH